MDSLFFLLFWYKNPHIFLGLSTLEGRDDPLEDWKNKFWTSYKVGLLYYEKKNPLNKKTQCTITLLGYFQFLFE